jgi:hypothetical protein
VALATHTDGHFCPRHQVSYGALDACDACTRDPGPAPDADLDEPLPEPPHGCLSSEDIERRFVKDARNVAVLIRVMRSGPLSEDWHVANTIAKLYDVKTKLLRAAAERARHREDEEIVKRRERRQREMRGAAH